MTPKMTTTMKVLLCGLLAFLAADLQAQLLYKTKYCTAEGFTNGWAIGQPSTGPLVARPYRNLNDIDPSYGSYNTGHSYIDPDTGKDWYIAQITNCTPAGGKLIILGDGNLGTNNGTYMFGITIGNGVSNAGGGITVTWDWQYTGTNGLKAGGLPDYGPMVVPADYDVTNNNYMTVITNGATKWPEFDHGVCLADEGNRYAVCNGSAPNWKYCCNCTPVRTASRCDVRDNIPGDCGGNGNWNANRGPQFADGKLIHMKYTAYAGISAANNTDDPIWATNNCFDVWAQREGEGVWQTAHALGGDTDPDGWFTWPSFGFRSCPGETVPTSGINMINFWYNGSKYHSYMAITNMRIVGPNPVARPTLSIAKVAGVAQVTFTGWLEAKSAVPGAASDWVTVAVQPYPYTTPTVYTPPAGTKMFYRASM